MWRCNDKTNTLLNTKYIFYIHKVENPPHLVVSCINGNNYKLNYNSVEEMMEEYNKFAERG